MSKLDAQASTCRGDVPFYAWWFYTLCRSFVYCTRTYGRGDAYLSQFSLPVPASKTTPVRFNCDFGLVSYMKPFFFLILADNVFVKSGVLSWI